MFICMPKVKFIIHFFLEILHFKKPCNYVGWKHLGPKLETQSFARYGIGVETSIKILVFILDYFQEKLMIKFFEKSKKILFWGHVAIVTFLAQIWAKMNFPGKRALTVFKYSNRLPSCQKSEKLICHSWGKCWTDGWMDRQTEWQTDNHDFVRPSVGRGSNY